MSDVPDEDKDDETDVAIKMAREHAIEAIHYLVQVMNDSHAAPADRLKASQHVLEVAGCLSL